MSSEMDKLRAEVKALRKVVDGLRTLNRRPGIARRDLQSLRRADRAIEATAEAAEAASVGALTEAEADLRYDALGDAADAQAAAIAASQPLDAALTSVAGLTTAANKGIYTTAADTYATFDLSPFARTFLDDVNGPAVLATIGAQAAITPSAGWAVANPNDLKTFDVSSGTDINRVVGTIVRELIAKGIFSA